MSRAAATADWTREEMMTIAASRLLWNGCVCFVGIGLPGAACNLARLTHAPDLVLVYESGTLGTKPDVLPLSIGDGELATTAACVIPLPEVFAWYLQAGRIDVGFLGAAQIDPYGNLNSTVIGPYDAPTTRLPGAGGATEIAAHARRTYVLLKASPRSCVARLDFRTSGCDAGARSAGGRGPRAVITDFGVLTPDAARGELMLDALYPGATVEEARSCVAWPLAVAGTVRIIDPPRTEELAALRALQARTRAAHGATSAGGR